MSMLDQVRELLIIHGGHDFNDTTTIACLGEPGQYELWRKKALWLKIDFNQADAFGKGCGAVERAISDKIDRDRLDEEAVNAHYQAEQNKLAQAVPFMQSIDAAITCQDTMTHGGSLWVKLDDDLMRMLGRDPFRPHPRS